MCQTSTSRGLAMQINLLKHLQFPDMSTPVSSGKSSDGNAVGPGNSGAASAAAGPSRRGAVKGTADASPAPSARNQPGVIVSIRGEGAAEVGTDAGLVYTDKRKVVVSDEDLSPRFIGTKSEEFVNFAVQTMRQFADEQERAKGLAKPAASDDAHLIPRNLGDVQKLAARFKLFA